MSRRDIDLQAVLGRMGYSIERAEESWLQASRSDVYGEYDYGLLDDAYGRLEEVESDAQEALSYLGYVMDVWESDHTAEDCDESYCTRSHESEIEEEVALMRLEMAQQGARHLTAQPNTLT